MAICGRRRWRQPQGPAQNGRGVTRSYRGLPEQGLYRPCNQHLDGGSRRAVPARPAPLRPPGHPQRADRHFRGWGPAAPGCQARGRGRHEWGRWRRTSTLPKRRPQPSKTPESSDGKADTTREPEPRLPAAGGSGGIGTLTEVGAVAPLTRSPSKTSTSLTSPPIWLL